MSKDLHKLDRIPAEQLTAYERWELPVMDSQGNEHTPHHQVEEEEIEVQPLTAQDLEDIRQEAWKEGHQEGFQSGREEGLKAGHDEGFQQGLEQGLQQGVAEGERQGQENCQAEIDAALQRLDQIAGELMEPVRRHQEEIEQALLNLALAVSRTVIRRELSLDSRQILNVVQDALESLPDPSEHVRLHVNPQDAPYVRQLAKQQQENWLIIESAEVLAGGCKVESRYSMVDYTVEKRFQLTVQQMLDRHTAVLPPEESADLTGALDDMTNFRRELLESAGRTPGPDTGAGSADSVMDPEASDVPHKPV